MNGAVVGPREKASASRSVGAVLIACFVVACSESTRSARSNGDWLRFGGAPDELPHMLNAEPPFRYPWYEYSRRVEGDVLLRLHVDTLGRVVPDSTRVSETSGHAALDLAAVTGASALRFAPARRRGTPIAVSMIFPVHFRHPDGAKGASRKDSKSPPPR